MFCMNCGQQLPDGAKFCFKCGTPLGAVSPSESTNHDVQSPMGPADHEYASMESLTDTALLETVNTSPFVPLKTKSQESLNSNPFVPLGQTSSNPAPTFVPAMCPNCNAHMKVDPSSKVARCESCGTECLVNDAIKTLTVNGNVMVGNATINVSGTNTESLLQRAELLLSEGDFIGAAQKCDSVLDFEPTNGRAYYYLLMSSLNCRRASELANQQNPFDGNPYYLKAMQYGDNDIRNDLQTYNNIILTKLSTKLSSLSKGENVLFGNFNGQALHWKVLTVENGMALIISSNILQLMPYHISDSKITWENSSIRNWLNSIFYESSFAPAEKAKIVLSTNFNNSKMNFFTNGGNSTNDFVFLLSLAEVKRYLFLPSSRSLGQWWWLRTPGLYQNWALAVNGDGKLSSDGHPVHRVGGIRPALWIKVN